MKLGNYNVKFEHKNFTGQGEGKLSKMNNEHKASSTKCEISFEDHPFMGKGEAKLHAGDNFCKETGRRLSLGRAMKNLGLTKEERREVWEAYRTSSVKPRW